MKKMDRVMKTLAHIAGLKQNWDEQNLGIGLLFIIEVRIENATT